MYVDCGSLGQFNGLSCTLLFSYGGIYVTSLEREACNGEVIIGSEKWQLHMYVS